MRFTKKYSYIEADEYTAYTEYRYKVMDCIELNHEDIVDVAIDKLGEYEDLDDKIGINFKALYHILSDGVCLKLDSGEFVKLNGNDLSLCCEDNCFFIKHDKFGKLEFKDYRKTWAITKEELTLPF